MISVKRSLLVIFLCYVSLSAAQFSWSDCGVQLYKDIHYQSASISEPTVNNNGSLSINVQATIVSTLYNANTQVIIMKDDEEFLNVQIDQLCDIIGTTKSLSCPLAVGQVSFTYQFTSVPLLPSGSYTVKIRSLAIADGTEVGCLQLEGTVDSLDGSSCHYTSSLTVSIDQIVNYQQATATQRVLGDFIQVGPFGNSQPYGTFSSKLAATPDIIGSDSGGSLDMSSYSWSLNGTLQDLSTTDNGDTLQVFLGDWTVYYTSPSTGIMSTVFTGNFNWTEDYNAGRTPTVIYTVSFWLNPLYSDNSLYPYPSVVGNLGPFMAISQPDRSFIVTGSHTWCTCEVDDCGVCGGNDKSCLIGVVKKPSSWTDQKYAAVIIGAVGGPIGIIAIAYFYALWQKAKKNRPHDDSDLIDHPQKPDYGTMAIDEMINEGERVN